MNLLWAAAEQTAAAGSSKFMSTADVVIFFAFILLVIIVAFGVSRKSGDSSESYFLAGRGLTWWIIGFSLIAANISAEQFIGMSGQASDYIGLAVASYEWIAAVSLVIVAFFFLPKFLKAGIYTIPEYLERRYNKSARTIMSLFMMIMLVAVNITVVINAGAKNYAVFFQSFQLKEALGPFAAGSNPLDLQFFCWAIGIIAALYVFAGGLKACAWADLIQGSALIAGGAIVLYFALKQLGVAEPAVLAGAPNVSNEMAEGLRNSGALERFSELNASKLRMNLPSWDTVLPCTALVFAIWIPNLYYWGLNQYIIQRTLGAKSLGEGQKGLVFASCLKLLIPFIVIFPGLIAFNLYHGDMRKTAVANSQTEVDRFEKMKNASVEEARKYPLFNFNHDFAKVEPEKAKAMLEYNARVAGVKIATKSGDRDLTLDQQLAELQKTIKADHRQSLSFSQYAKELFGISKSTQLTFGAMATGFDHDSAFPLLVRNLVPQGGFKGFLLAALLGAIVSSVAAMLNAASTIFTMDIYKEYIHKAASQKSLVLVGRITVILFVLIGCVVAPIWSKPEFGGIFKAIQEFQGYISPGIFAAFLFGFCVKKAPAACGTIALVLCPIIYGLFHMLVPQLDFLNRMLVTFVIIMGVLFILRILFPRKTAYEQTSDTTLDLTQSKLAKVIGVLVVLGTIALYLFFWDHSSKMF